eukprot:m.217666 g.217666  ORF g.217666 m.217666 type:complete len:583 (-) comp15890_c0_seq5:35-1783(-)
MSWDLRHASHDQVLQAAKVLHASKRVGHFILRGNVQKSGPSSGALGLTVVADSSTGRLANFLVEKQGTSYIVRGSDKSFRNVNDLINYYAVKARHPLPVKLVKARIGMDEDDDDEEESEFGFASEDEGSEDLKTERVENQAPVPDTLSLSLLQKNLEILAAKRRAAELNVQLLSGEGPKQPRTPHYTSPQYEVIQPATSKPQVASASGGGNDSILEGWKAQLAELDRLRSMLPKEGSGHLLENIEEQRRERILRIQALQDSKDGEEQKKSTSSELNTGRPSVSKLYEDMGTYTDKARLARETQQALDREEAELLAEEAKLREEEDRLRQEVLITQAIEAEARRIILAEVDKAVMRVELQRIEEDRAAEALALEREKAVLEQKLSYTAADREDKERRLNEISSMMRPLAGILSGYESRNEFRGGPASNSPQNNPRNYTQNSPQKQWWNQGGQNSGKEDGGARAYSPNRPSYSASKPSYSASSNAQVYQFNALRKPSSGYPESSHIYDRIPGDNSDEERPKPGWRNNLRTSAPGGRNMGTENTSAAPFSIVKFKKPKQFDQPGGNNDPNDTCTFLGNCTCPKCR